MTPDRLIDEAIENDIDFYRECRRESENPHFPEQLELIEEDNT